MESTVLPRLFRIVLLAATFLLVATQGCASQDAPSVSFTLADAAGRTVRSDMFAGEWLLVYFGYTHCADQCPTTLGDMAEALNALGAVGERVQPVFITIDPARDGGAQLTSFTAAFDPRILGLGGSEEQVAHAAAQFGVRYSKVALAQDGGYSFDHSGGLFLLDPAERLVTRFGHMSDPYMIETKLLQLLAEPVH
jgi:cytochrome oxidase Cu insertion factor (SCO1/SenC/PrrC family)